MTDKLTQLIDRADAIYRAGPDAARDVTALGAMLRFRGGAWVMRLAGIAGTSTTSAHGALASWLTAARAKVRQGVG